MVSRSIAESLPANAAETHVSLFDGSNCGIALTDRPAFSVQHHPKPRPARATAITCSSASSNSMAANPRG